MSYLNSINLNAVFNLQEPGEHPLCGDPMNYKTGFTYNPEILFKNKISFYNFSWPDMDVPDLTTMFNIVQLMDYHIRKKSKVLVHCHAGMGRTGLTIACYLVYGQNYNEDQAINSVKTKRKEAFNKKIQIEFLNTFSKCLQELKIMFYSDVADIPNWIDLLFYQKFLIHGEERKLLQNCPKLVFESVKRIISLINETSITAEEVIESFLLRSKYNQNELNDLIEEITCSLNKGDWKNFYSIGDTKILSQILLKYLDQFSVPIITESLIDEIFFEIENINTYESIFNTLMHKLNKIEFTILMIFCVLLMNIESRLNEFQNITRFKSRISISLLSLRNIEYSSFLGNGLLNVNFQKKDLINKLNDLLSRISSVFRNKVIEVLLINDSQNTLKPYDPIENLLIESSISLKQRIFKEEDASNASNRQYSVVEINNIMNSVYSEINGSIDEHVDFYTRFENAIHRLEENNKLDSDTQRNINTPNNPNRFIKEEYTPQSKIKSKLTYIPIKTKIFVQSRNLNENIKNIKEENEKQEVLKIKVERKPSSIHNSFIKEPII